MKTVASQLDKSLATTMSEGYGAITIRVVVLEKASYQVLAEGAPADAEADEVLPEQDKRPTAGYLEESKRGRQCGVFLINGQRQHAWDNQFIVRDLEMPYLRNRMIVVVDCDGMKPEIIAQLKQEQTCTFREGDAYQALKATIIRTLRADPDLSRIHDDVEDSVRKLPSASPAVLAMFESLIQ
ncbi:MAG: hypothetical protein NTY65_02910 [Planctomycetota bacterium]|nr:hypothetical protein [Planctomycetota bacterium]